MNDLEDISNDDLVQFLLYGHDSLTFFENQLVIKATIKFIKDSDPDPTQSFTILIDTRFFLFFFCFLDFNLFFHCLYVSEIRCFYHLTELTSLHLRKPR